jgi:hypothetical protein
MPSGAACAGGANHRYRHIDDTGYRLRRELEYRTGRLRSEAGVRSQP